MCIYYAKGFARLCFSFWISTCLPVVVYNTSNVSKGKVDIMWSYRMVLRKLNG